MKVRRFSAALSAGLLVFAFTGCGKVADKVAEKGIEKGIEKSSGGSVDIDSKGKGMSFKDKDGNEFSMGASKTLPDGWPSDILPMPDGFQIVNVTQLKDDGTTSKSVMSQGKGDPEKIIAPYKKNFESNGFEIQSESQMGGMFNLTGTKGEKSSVTVSAMGDDDSDEVTLTMHYRVSAEEGS